MLEYLVYNNHSIYLASLRNSSKRALLPIKCNYFFLASIFKQVRVKIIESLDKKCCTANLQTFIQQVCSQQLYTSRFGSWSSKKRARTAQLRQWLRDSLIPRIYRQKRAIVHCEDSVNLVKILRIVFYDLDFLSKKDIS